MTLHSFVTFQEAFMFFYFLGVNSFYAGLLLSAAVELRHHHRTVQGEHPWRILGSEVAPRVTMLAPAHNEETTVVDSVRGFLNLYYPDLEVVVINDGSEDGTLRALIEHFEMVRVEPVYDQRLVTQAIRGLYRSEIEPHLVLIDKENGGKADSLNLGLQVATGDLICAMDADTLVEPDALQKLVRPFVLRDDVVAAGGTLRVVNQSLVRNARVVAARTPRRPVSGFQAVEYCRAFLFGRLGLNRLGGNLIVSGAFGLFRRESVLAVGGYAHGTVGEDMELVVRLRRRGIEQGGPSRAQFIPDPVAWTEVPPTLSVLVRQRDRWHRGLADSLWRHRDLFFNRRYGKMGLISYPYFVLVELLAPVVEAWGLLVVVVSLYLGILGHEFALAFFLVAYVYGSVLSVVAMLLDENAFGGLESIKDRLLLLFWALLESLGYRQVTVYSRLKGLVKFFLGRKEWGKMERAGFIQ